MLVTRALVVILLALFTFTAIVESPMTLEGLSGITLSYPPYIRLTNCILAAICGAFLMWPRESGQLVGNWNRYVGLAFFTFSVQYGLRFLAAMLGLQFPDYREYFTAFAVGAAYLGSYFNNILFLAAARTLLNKNKRVQAAALPADGRAGRARLRREWARLRAALPDWYLIMFLPTLLALLEELERLPPDLLQAWLPARFSTFLLFVRIPDAIFSVYCLSWFAYAIWLNYYVHRQRWLARLGLVLVLAYAAGQVVYAANPFISRSLDHPALGWFPATAVRSYLEPKRIPEKIRSKVNEENAAIDRKNREAAEAARRDGRVPEKPKQRKRFFEGARDYFDSAIFAILTPMKLLLFLPAFILYLLSLSSVNGFRQVLRELTNKRKDFLSKDGILDVIGSSMDADELELSIRVPGVRRRENGTEERLISEVWRAPGAPVWREQPRLSSLDDDPLLRRAMKEEGHEIIINDQDEGAAAAGLRAHDPLPQTLVVVPIKFHGGVIGVLRIIFRGYGKYNDGTLEQLKFMAELIAPSVQDFRTVSAVDKLGPRFSRALDARQGDPQANSFEHAAGQMAETLYDLLNPLSVGLRLNCGFRAVSRAFPVEGADHDILQSPEAGYNDPPQGPGDDAAARGPHGGDDESPIIVRTERGPVRVERDHLLVRKEQDFDAAQVNMERLRVPFDLGTLYLTIHDERDEFAHPTLAAYYLTRRAIASQTAHGILNAARNALGLLVQDLGVKLNKETLSSEEWLKEVEAAASKAGLLWAVASEGEGRPRLGQLENLRVLDGLGAEERARLMSGPLGCAPNPDPESATRHIIHLRLKEPGQHLWLGVERAQFGEELTFKSPWRVFLLNLADVAGAALARIKEGRRAEEERLREEARRRREADDEWLKTFSDLNAAVMHQLINMVQNMLSISRKLEDASRKPHDSKEQLLEVVGDLKDYSVLMLGVYAAYNKLIRGDGRGYCDFAEATKLAEKLFRFDLKERKINLEIKVEPGAVAEAPIHLVVLAMSSLIKNAIDAISASGTIKICAEPRGAVVWCRVFNDGPPIPDEIRPILFERVWKGKPGHSGYGLYLVSRILQNYEGDIELSYSSTEGTCFTLRLPKSINLLPLD
jgi:signal transduction histidine kinase